jgi:hypothetical protein
LREDRILKTLEILLLEFGSRHLKFPRSLFTDVKVVHDEQLELDEILEDGESVQ